MQLSHSALSVFRSCPRCFYIDRHFKVTRPRGIFSSLPNSVDRLLKDVMDGARGTLPKMVAHPALDGFVLYEDGAKLKKMRDWRTNPLNLKYGQTGIVGAFDDLLVNKEKKTFAILDVKTKGSAADQAYCEQYYQEQIDLYTLFLSRNGWEPAGFGVLLYFWPVVCENATIKFGSGVFILKASPESADELIAEALACLDQPEVPEPSVGCEHCKFVASVGAVVV